MSLLERIALHGLGRHDAPPVSLRPRLPHPFEGAGEPIAVAEPIALEARAPSDEGFDEHADADPRRIDSARHDADSEAAVALPAPHSPDSVLDPSAQPVPQRLPAVDTPEAPPPRGPSRPEESPVSPRAQALATARPYALDAPAKPRADKSNAPPALPVAPARHAAINGGLIAARNPSAAPLATGLRARPDGRDPLPREIRTAPPEPVIEIHIGRIDVRAQVAPPPPAAPRSAPSAPEPSLNRYLATRGRGARS